MAHLAPRSRLGGNAQPSEALELGIVSEVVPRERLEQTVEEMAAEIALCPVTTLTACKLLIKRAWELMGFRLHQQWSADRITTVAAHSDFRAHLVEMMKKTGGRSEWTAQLG